MSHEPSSILRVVLALTLAASAAPVAAPDPHAPASSGEVARLRAHYAAAERELRSRDTSHLAPAQRAARARALDALAEYRERGEFGINRIDPSRRLMGFVDDGGRRCAVAHLLHEFGEDALVERVADASNAAYVAELAGDRELAAWLDSVGLTIDEAARIQGPQFTALPPTAAEGFGQGGMPDAAGATGAAAPATAPTAASARADAGSRATTAGGLARRSDGNPVRAARTGERTSRAGASTASADRVPVVDDWWIWWEMNKLRFLEPNRPAGEQGVAARYDQTSPQLAERRANAIPLLRAALADHDADVRARAAVALGRVAGAPAVADLLPLLEDSSLYVRHGALLGLGATGAHASVPLLMHVAREGVVPDGDGGSLSPYARPLALVALAIGRRHGLDGAVDRFVADMADELRAEDEGDVGTALLLYQTLTADERTAEVALALFRDEDAEPATRCRATESLRARGDATVLPELTRALDGPHVEVRRSAALALGGFRNALLVPRLQTTFEVEEDPVTRGFALLSLGEQGGGTARDFLVDTLRSGPRASRPWAALALGILAREADDAAARSEILRALRTDRDRSRHGAYVLAAGIARDTEAIGELEQRLLDDADPRMRMFAALALGMIGDDVALPRLREQLGEERSSLARVGILQALGLFGRDEDAGAMLGSVRELSTVEDHVLVAVAMGLHGTWASVDGLLAIAGAADLPATSRGAAVEAIGLVLDRGQALLLSELSSDANFHVFPEWVLGMLTSFSL